jgi:hypothetical protein
VAAHLALESIQALCLLAQLGAVSIHRRRRRLGVRRSRLVGLLETTLGEILEEMRAEEP